jgi:lipid A 3-O-deacylase
MNFWHKLTAYIWGSTAVLTLLITPDFALAEEGGASLKKVESNWTLLSGYGITHNGMGKTQINVETFDLVLGHEKKLTGTIGSGAIKGYHSFVVELPVHFVVDPWEDPMFGLNFLARWTFESNDKVQPYIFGGGGPVYTDAKIKGLGSHLNGNWQFGLGLNLPSFASRDFVVEYRFHHISNLNTKTPNDSLNSSKLLFGVKF